MRSRPSKMLAWRRGIRDGRMGPKEARDGSKTCLALWRLTRGLSRTAVGPGCPRSRPR
jgi:hypothetical protein